MLAATSGIPHDQLVSFARQLMQDAIPELETATGRAWHFHITEPLSLGSNERRHAGDFLGEGSLRLVEGSFDLIAIITDIAVMSRRDRIVFGLSSPLARTVVLSTHRLRRIGRGDKLALDARQVRMDAAALLLHLIGQTLGVASDPHLGTAMSPFQPNPERERVPPFGDRKGMEHLASRFPEREHSVRSPVGDLGVHLGSALRHPRLVLRALLRNRAILLPLKMPALATAAVAPVFVLVFSAEFWDAGLGMSQLTAWSYAGVSILAASLFLCFAQRLFLPRKESHIVPEHLAVANVVIFLSMLLAIIGLFVMVAALALAIELWVFPSDLISTWPTLSNEQAGIADLLKIAVFISTVGVTTGALAGGLQRRQVLRHMALFQTEV